MAGVDIRPFASAAEAQWAARTMAESEPWITLGTGYERSLAFFSNESRERYLAQVSGEPAGFLVVTMQGAFVGYVQLLGVAAKFRGQGVGRALIEFAERRVFRETPNVFICVSDFNAQARGFYAKLGYQTVGELKDFVVAGHAEILLRKTMGPIRSAGKS